MNFVAFIVLACDISGRPCDEYQMLYADISPLTCQMVSPRLVERFVEAHPLKWPKKWRCEWAGLQQKV